ncbi:MAG: guanylate kinase [Cyclonatronaceae bacterium]
MQTARIFILTAPSGGGKTTIAHRLLQEFPKLVFSVSATTRARREGETDGKDYYFLTRAEFDRRIEAGAFIEWEEFYGGSRYGTLKDHIDNHLKKGYFILFDVEVNGAKSLKEYFRDSAVSIFISPPSREELRRRLQLRGTENEKTLKLRLERAEMELEQADFFDYTVVNEHLDTAYAQVREIVAKSINNQE